MVYFAWPILLFIIKMSRAFFFPSLTSKTDSLLSGHHMPETSHLGNIILEMQWRGRHPEGKAEVDSCIFHQMRLLRRVFVPCGHLNLRHA